jgi:two-component sensor histidine kinase
MKRMKKDLDMLRDVIQKAAAGEKMTAREKRSCLLKIEGLEKELKSLHDSRKENIARISKLLDVVMGISRLEYTVKAELKGKGDYFDGLARGINMLGAELQSSTISLHEKEVLLKEIHHRVKNNLQVISSLLSLQSATISDPYSLEKFTESRNRIRSMAMVHEKLYYGTDLSRINIEEYIVSLVNYLNSSYNPALKAVTVTVDIEITTRMFAIDEAIPCGLIINELLTNAYKYAFSKSGKGNLYVGFHEKKQKGKKTVFHLEVRDNGAGLPGSLDISTTATLGLQLVSLLTEQIGGTLKVSRTNGTRFQISFSPAY